jgi:hypothetical protein
LPLNGLEQGGKVPNLHNYAIEKKKIYLKFWNALHMSIFEKFGQLIFIALKGIVPRDGVLIEAILV